MVWCIWPMLITFVFDWPTSHTCKNSTVFQHENEASQSRTMGGHCISIRTVHLFSKHSSFVKWYIWTVNPRWKWIMWITYMRSCSKIYCMEYTVPPNIIDGTVVFWLLCSVNANRTLYGCEIDMANAWPCITVFLIIEFIECMYIVMYSFLWNCMYTPWVLVVYWIYNGYSQTSHCEFHTESLQTLYVLSFLINE